MALKITYKISTFCFRLKMQRTRWLFFCDALIEFHSNLSHVSIIDAFKSRKKKNKRIENIFGFLFFSQFLELVFQ